MAADFSSTQDSDRSLTQQTSQTVLANGTSTSVAQSSKETNVALTSLSAPEIAWLEALSSQTFTPWPNDEVIRQSGLAQIQGMLERGEDPYGEPGVKAREASQVDEVTAEGQVGGHESRDEESNGKKMEAVEKMVREEKPKVFAMDDLYDPDAE